MDELQYRYNYIFRFIEGIQICEEDLLKSNDEDKEDFYKRMNIIDNFIKYVFEKMDQSSCNYINSKIIYDNDFIEKALLSHNKYLDKKYDTINTINTIDSKYDVIDSEYDTMDINIEYLKTRHNNYMLDRKKQELIEISSDSDNTIENKDIEYDSNDDINSIDSDKEDSILENHKLNKLFAKSMVELKMRRSRKDFFAEKIMV